MRGERVSKLPATSKRKCNKSDFLLAWFCHINVSVSEKSTFQVLSFVVGQEKNVDQNQNLHVKCFCNYFHYDSFVVNAHCLELRMDVEISITERLEEKIHVGNDV